MKDKYIVITPAGELEVNTLAEALRYKSIYGYPYIKKTKP